MEQSNILLVEITSVLEKPCIDVMICFIIFSVWPKARVGYSSMIWVGMCRWDLKSRPIFISNLTEKWDPLLYQSHKFKQNLPKILHYFPKLLSFQANFANLGIRLMKLGLFSRQFQRILKIWPMFIPVFTLNKGLSLYQEADFETHFSGKSLDRPLY